MTIDHTKMASSQMNADASLDVLHELLQDVQDLTLSRHESSTALKTPTIADPEDLQDGIANLADRLPEQGWGLERSGRYLLDSVAPMLAGGQSTTRYFGFVTGGVLPIAGLADNLVTLYDPNVQVHLPKETLSTLIEDHTITLLLQLLSLPEDQFTGTLTTGATTSNILALACAREEVLRKTMSRKLGLQTQDWSLAEEGLSEQVSPVNVFVTFPHASIKKAASVVGIGRKRVIGVAAQPQWRDDQTSRGAQSFLTEEEELQEGVKMLDFDLDELEQRLKAAYDTHQASIVVVGMGEVNTGALTSQLPALRRLCDAYDAWLHVDAAFSAFVGLLQGYEWVSEQMSECADSITSDAHKQLNVPYDAGLLFIRKHADGQGHGNVSLLEDVCGPGRGAAAPAYLKAPTGGETQQSDNDDPDADAVEFKRKSAYAANLPSPLFKNLENSRRFRALPIYAMLLCEGREGIRAMVHRNVSFAQAIKSWMRHDKQGAQYYQVLTPGPRPTSTETAAPPPTITTTEPWAHDEWSTTIILFRPHPLTNPVERFRKNANNAFVDAIKATRKIYISPTTWHGVPAARIAVSNWRTGLEDEQGHLVDRVEDSYDFKVTIETLVEIMQV